MKQKLLSGNVVVKIKGSLARMVAAVVGRTRLLALAIVVAGSVPAWAFNTSPTIANNTFPATNAGQTLTQTVTLTLTSASAIKSIVIAPASATSTEYKLNGITGCTVDGATSNATGTVCSFSITYTAPLATAPNPPQILYTDASFNTTAYGIAPSTPAASVTYASTLVFNPALVTITPASAQSLTATFTLDNFSTAITPTASLHYGLAYSAGSVSCSGSAGSQTCTVPVTFLPNYPGGRKEALFLLSGTTRLATVLVYGVGQAPFAMIQPGVITNPVLNSSQIQYGSVVDENGTVYVVEQGANAIEAVTKAGVISNLPITGLNSPRAVGIDGAGVLYVADQTPNSSTKTYDTVQGIQGSVPYPAGAFYVQSVTVGNVANLYETDSTSVFTVPIAGAGKASTVTINPFNIQAYQLIVDSSEDVFLGGYDINETTPAGVQTQVNTVGDLNGLSVDAAGTLYSTRYLGPPGNASTGVAMLPASNYAQYELAVDVGQSPSGGSVGPDGTVYVGNYSNLDKVDRTQGNLVFGEQQSPTTPATQTAQIYNGGNLPLSISNIAISSNGGFTIGTAPSNNCAVGIPVAAGAYCNLLVSFLSPHAGTFTGTLSITTNSLNITSTTQSIAVSAFTYGVYITASPTTLNFGNQMVGTTSAPQTVTLTNSGDLYSASLGNATFSGSGYNVTLVSCGSVGPGATCTANVTFSPTAVQGYNGVVATHNVSSNGGGADQLVTYTLNGTGVTASAPQAVLSPTSVAFGNQIATTTSAAQTVTLSNSGTAALTISSVTITGAGVADFAISANTCGASLAAGANCAISLTFTPASTSSYSASLSVADNVTGSPQTVALTGTGVTPQATLSPTTVAFGNQGVSTTSSAQTITLTNPGTAALTISSVSITGANPADFTIAGNTCGSRLAAAGSCTISVTFTPASAASFSATLSVADNVTGSPQTVALSGTGTLAQAVLSPTTLAFPNTTMGVTSAALTTVLSNPGTAPLTITGITLGGANAADFALTNGCGGTLAAGASCNLSVTFTPASVASFAATISVADNVTGSPQNVALTGTGTAPLVPIATLTPSTIAFGNQNVATTSAAQTLTLKNTGTAALTITGITLGGANPAAFTQSANTCGATLAVNGSCTIGYTFTPLAAASYAATVSVADNTASSPQTATLTGTGVATGDFSMTGAPSVQTVNPGGVATFTINLASLNGGFGLPVTLSVTGLPTGAQGSFAPSVVTPGTGIAIAVLTVQTSQQYGALQRSHGLPEVFLALGLLPLLAGLGFGVRRRGSRHRRLMPLLAGLALLAVSLGVSGCSGGYFGPPPQVFTLIVTGSSAATQHSTTVTLNVQ